MASRSNLYDYLYTLGFHELLDLYQNLLESSCEHYDLELEDTLYEIEQILFSADDEVLTMAIMEHYPHGYPTERPIPVPPPSPPHNEDRILAAAEDRAWVHEMPREADGWDMLAAYGLPQVPLPELGGWVQD
ncbi:hypothetical protein R1sor_021084 [Riccia sorocarpa]|uniref:Uncharacterized protein n=1 Tax=Riccia sorocarpa TaxID=122646 RepID=A0ABD3GGR9_9MARC